MIREVIKKDLDGLLRLYTQLHNNPVPERSEALRTLWDQIQNDPNYHILADEEAGALVSSCILLIVPNLTHGQRPYGIIENVVTDQAYRGQGRASAVLHAAKQLAQTKNCYKLMLMTGSKQENTLNFYRRAGYNSKDKTAFVQWLNP